MPFRIDCEPCVKAIHYGVKWATTGRRKHARVHALMLAALDDMPSDQAVWMPAHTKIDDIGKAKLGDGSTLTKVDRDSNAVADLHAKAAASEVRVPAIIRKKLDEYHAMTKEAARWIGEITYTANHRSEAPYRDSIASRLAANEARIGRAKTKGPTLRPPTEPRPVSLGGHAISPVDGRVDGRVWCSVCRATSSKPRFCMSRCTGSAAAKWAEAARKMANSGSADGGRHTRMISGSIIWCSTCGSYADLRVSGLTEACLGKHTGPWLGGGKVGQLKALLKNIHPRNGTQLPAPIAETMLALDATTVTALGQQHEAKQRASRYTAKDKAVARRIADHPKTALTAEKRQWIEVKRAEAKQRQTQKMCTQVDQHSTAADTEAESTVKKAKIEARIKARMATKRPPADDFVQQSGPAARTSSGTATRPTASTAEDEGDDIDARPPAASLGGGGNDEDIECERCGRLHDWPFQCFECMLVACSWCATYSHCPDCNDKLCAECRGTHRFRCSSKVGSAQPPKTPRCTVINCFIRGCNGGCTEHFRDDGDDDDDTRNNDEQQQPQQQRTQPAQRECPPPLAGDNPRPRRCRR